MDNPFKASSGKVYKVGKVGAGAQMRVRRILSKEKGLTDDPEYLLLCLIYESIETIDNMPEPKCMTPQAFEELADEIGDDLKDIAPVFKELNGVTEDKEAEIDLAKKSQGVPT